MPVSPKDGILKAGRVAVITGCSTGIGKAAAKTFAGLGMKVVMADNDEAALAAAHAEVSAACPGGAGDCLAVPTDVSDLASLTALKDKVFSSFGGVHLLMNNAGVMRSGTGPLADRGAWETTIGVNMWGVINGCQVFVPAMKEKGEPGIIINTGSKQGITFPPGNLAYNCSKAVVKAYTEGLQHELRNVEGGVLAAYLLVPGWVNTDLMLKDKRREAEAAGKADAFDPMSVFFSEGKPASGAWMPQQCIDYMIEKMSNPEVFYIICPDNEVDEETDRLRMRWTAGDVAEGRVPLSRWHPEYKDKFSEYVAANKGK